MTSLKKDESDPRALAYVYQQQDSFSLFYIKMANLAEPVLVDIEEVCQVVEQATTPEEPAENDSMLLLNDSSAPPTETSSSSELLEVFSFPVKEPVMSTQSSCIIQPAGASRKSVGSPSGGTVACYADVGTSKQPDRSSSFSTRNHEGWKHGGFTHHCQRIPDLSKLPVSPHRAYSSASWACLAVLLTSCYTGKAADFDCLLRCRSQGESIDVKALRARFNNRTSTSDTSSRDSGSPKSPQPGFGRSIPPATENDPAHRKLSPTVPAPMPGSGPIRFPKADPPMANKVKQTGEMLENLLLKQRRLPVNTLTLSPAQASAAAIPQMFRQKPRQRNAGNVTPLRRPLPPEGPLPLKPKRPPNVNLELVQRSQRSSSLPSPRKQNAGCPGSAGRNMSLPAVISPPTLPQRCIKPSRLPRQAATVDIEDFQEAYDDITTLEMNESRPLDSQGMDEVDEDVYESIDEDQVEASLTNIGKKTKKKIKRDEQEKKDETERRKKENELRKNFQLHNEDEILQTARIRHDWHGGGKLDLNVRQGETVEILRVTNNPGGKWLARSLKGNYGYISNTCVDVDDEAFKHNMLHSENIDMLPLPPPPPDPPQMLNVESTNRDSMLEDYEDDDDVQLIAEDFPPPPPDVSIDPKVVKELRKRFKYYGPLRAQHTMMVDPNSIIKKPGGKDLHVTQGQILDVIHFTNSKKALCRNQFGKYGYVSRSLLLQMEGDIYDEVEYADDIYDNDSPHPGY
ncbi:FYN-binding protein 1 [Brachionichthys hirsutus]|uniref:FYN-binding protein 1 n=1 Tax=Brachionichthys hirsutus TaxID=412623 RepID=UPI003604DE22